MSSEQIAVHDQGYIELQDYMGDDLSVVAAARVSYLGETKGITKDIKLLKYLWDHKHLSPFEQVQFRFRVKAPILVARQWMRYRTAHVNEQSYRYTDAVEEDFYVPHEDEWRLQDAKNKQGSDGNMLARQGNAWTITLANHIAQGYKFYNEALEAGIAREEARLFLAGFSIYTQFIWTIDLRNLLHFLDERCDAHAQKEIRDYAIIIRDVFLPKVVPFTHKIYLGLLNLEQDV